MTRIRTRLILVFIAATIVPLVATLYIMTLLLERSLDIAPTREIDQLSQSLEATGRDYYQLSRNVLRDDAKAGSISHERFVAAQRADWPPAVAEFADSGETERFALSESGGNRLEYYVRHDEDVWMYSRQLGGIGLDRLTQQIGHARDVVQQATGRDLRKGFTTTLIILVAVVWCCSFVWLIYLANRISRPIRQLTAGLSELASGNLNSRIEVLREGSRKDEIGRAIEAFNRSAGELQQSRDRLVYLTQMASWQSLARKMAHELKNSLTPIRLTVEEILARQPAGIESTFLEEAVRIVVNEVESLERRVRAFSEFSAEPAVCMKTLSVQTILEERIAFLKSGHPEVAYTLEAVPETTEARADPDRVKGILTNLLENAADAAGPGGRVLGRLAVDAHHVIAEIHDSGAGLNAESRQTLFEPTISFKRHGTGLGLSIARKDALVCGGNLLLIEGVLSGAAFRLILPKAQVHQ